MSVLSFLHRWLTDFVLLPRCRKNSRFFHVYVLQLYLLLGKYIMFSFLWDHISFKRNILICSIFLFSQMWFLTLLCCPLYWGVRAIKRLNSSSRIFNNAYFSFSIWSLAGIMAKDLHIWNFLLDSVILFVLIVIVIICLLPVHAEFVWICVLASEFRIRRVLPSH